MCCLITVQDPSDPTSLEVRICPPEAIPVFLPYCVHTGGSSLKFRKYSTFLRQRFNVLQKQYHLETSSVKIFKNVFLILSELGIMGEYLRLLRLHTEDIYDKH